MRYTISGPGLSVLWIAFLTSAIAGVVPARAYVNGGDFHSAQKTFANRLHSDGWATHFAAALPRDCRDTREAAADVRVVPAENAEFRNYVNQMVGKAIQALPDQAAGVPLEDKREVARLAREAIRKAVMSGEEVTKEGRVGDLQYQVGVRAFESYWETNYGGKREIHARTINRVPFVALKLVPAREKP
jgi:hypothetical protein